MSSSQITPLHSTTPFITAYSPKLKTAICFPEQSPHTKQSFKDECDINTIMARYMSTGQLPDLALANPQYFDASGADFQQSMEFVAGAQSLFAELPSQVRNRFGNDPAAFLDFCSHDKNRPELAEMGLLRPNAHVPGVEPTPEPKTAPKGSKPVSAPAPEAPPESS